MPAYADRQLLWHIAEDTCAAYRASHKRSRCAIALPRRNEPERLHVAIRRLYAGSPQREKRTLDTARGSYPTAKLSNPSKGKASGGSNAENSSRSNNNESNTSKASSIVQTALEKPKQLSKAARASLSAASFRSAHDELRSTSSSRWCETTNQEKVVPLEQLPLEFPSEGYPPTLPRVTDEWLLRLAMGLNRPGVADDHFSIPTSWQIENNERLEYLGDAVIGLVVRQMAYARHPDFNPGGLSFLTSHLVSNIVASHLWDLCELDSLREQVAVRLAAQAEAKREVERMAGPVMDRKQGQPKAVTGASATRVGAVASDEMGRQAADGKVPDLSSMNASEPGTAAPISRHALPVLTQQRKADYFEAYLGALFLSSGYASVTGWLEPLLEPWLERAARDWRFKSGEQFKTAAAKMRARDAVERDRLEEEKRKEILKGELNELGPIRRVARWVTKSVVGWVWPEVKLVESNRSSGQCTREKRN